MAITTSNLPGSLVSPDSSHPLISRNMAEESSEPAPLAESGSEPRSHAPELKSIRGSADVAAGPGGIEDEAPVGVGAMLDSGGGENATASKELDEIFGSGEVAEAETDLFAQLDQEEAPTEESPGATGIDVADVDVPAHVDVPAASSDTEAPQPVLETAMALFEEDTGTDLASLISGEQVEPLAAGTASHFAEESSVAPVAPLVSGSTASLFGEDAGPDLTDLIGGGDQTVEPEETPRPVAESATTLFGEDTGPDLAALIGGDGDQDAEPVEPVSTSALAPAEDLPPPVSESATALFGEDTGPDLAALIGGGHLEAEEEFMGEVGHDKDYSDLLREFEAEGELLEPSDVAVIPPPVDPLTATLQPTASIVQYPESQSAAALFGDGVDSSSPFDAFEGSTTALPPSSTDTYSRAAPDAEPHVGDTSVHSLFSNDSDWLADTTIDQSFQTDTLDTSAASGLDENQPASGDGLGALDALDFEVPLGWYDESGQFQYYTEAERDEVRATMLAQSGWGADQGAATTDRQTSLGVDSALGGGFSENAARRTPQPEQLSTLPSQAYDPYAPPATSQYAPPPPAPVSSSTSSAQQSYFPPQPVYTPSTASTAYSATPAIGYGTTAPAAPAAPIAASPYDPYAPAPQPFAQFGAGPSTRAGPSAPPVAAPVAPQEPRAKPQRVASNAYDPPLRPQKSFVRPPSTVPSLSPFASSPSIAPPLPPAPPPGLAPPPPSGPPRRSPSDRPPPPPSAPPPGPPPRPDSTASTGRPAQYSPAEHHVASHPEDRPDQVQINGSATHTTHTGAYAAPPQSSPPRGPPSRPASSAARPPPQAPSYSAFDPPLRPPSSARSVSRAPLHAQFSPPPPPQALSIPSIVSPPQAESSQLPPRPSSRGPPGPPRKTSPMSSFDAPPPRKTSPMPSFDAPPPRKTAPMPSFDAPPPPRSQPTLSATNGFGTEAQARVPRMESPLPVPSFASPEAQWRAQAHAATVEPGARFEPPGEEQSGVEEEGGAVGDWRDEMEERPTSPKVHPSEPVEEAYRPQPSVDSHKSTTSDAYAPRDAYQPTQIPATSFYPPSNYEPPSSLGLQSMGPPSAPPPPQAVYDPYAPSASTTTTYDRRQDSYDPYSPPSHPTRSERSHTATSQASAGYQPSAYQPSFVPPATSIAALSPPPADVYGRAASPAHTSEYGTSPAAPNYFQSMHARGDETYVPQQVLEQRPIQEDPLGRCTLAARNLPLAVFGFGGTMITAFPGLADDPNSPTHVRKPSYGYASGRGQLWIRTVSELVAPSALSTNDTVFPGPLVFDVASPKSAANDKKKKEAVVKYLEARADEIEKGLPYLKSSASSARREEEGKLVLVRVLAAMILGDGRLSGKPEVEDALRAAFQNPSEPTSLPPSSLLSPSAKFGSPASHMSAGASSVTQLAQLSDLLLGGDKRGAAEFAASHGLWSHALVISSCVDQDLWREVVLRFSEAELGGKPRTAALRAAYTVFSGKAAENVDDLVAAANVSGDPSADQWREVLSSVVFNSNATQLNCLDELGQRFMAMGLVYPAHVCFLLSPSSPFGDVSPAAYGKHIVLAQNTRDEDAIVFAEIAEYARSLIPVPKGQEVPFPGLPQLLPYKLQRAWRAAELGELDQAQRYCNAVEAGSKLGKNGPTFLPGHLVASLEDLLERLTGTPSISPAKSLVGRKSAAKPGLDKLGSWIEGRLTKFIAGEEEGDGGSTTKHTPVAVAKGAASGPVGPFSHFTAISPAQSGPLSRNPSAADVPGMNGHLGVPGESMRTSPLQPLHGGSPHVGGHHLEPTDSSTSSYGDYMGHHGRDSSYTSWSAMQETPQEVEGDGFNGDAENAEDNDNDNGGEGEGEFINPLAAPMFGVTQSHNYEPAPSGGRANLAVGDDDEDDLGFGNAALSRDRTPKPPASEDTGEADSHGATPRKGADATKAKAESSANAEAKASASIGKGGLEPQKSSSWLKGWWGKKDGEGSGPIRAKLGEESSMVYDKELKRWVVKGAKGESSVPTPPPPPPRAQTASPSRAAKAEQAARAMSATPPPSQLSRSVGAPPPPPSGLGPGPGNAIRSSTAPTGFAETADGGIRRMKSSLAEGMTPMTTATTTTTGNGPPGRAGPPGSSPASANMSPASSGGPPPPPGGSRPPTAASLDDLLSRPPSKRPASAAAKKGARNRYVDVFQPGSEGTG